MAVACANCGCTITVDKDARVICTGCWFDFGYLIQRPIRLTVGPDHLKQLENIERLVREL